VDVTEEKWVKKDKGGRDVTGEPTTGQPYVLQSKLHAWCCHCLSYSCFYTLFTGLFTSNML